MLRQPKPEARRPKPDLGTDAWVVCEDDGQEVVTSEAEALLRSKRDYGSHRHGWLGQCTGLATGAYQLNAAESHRPFTFTTMQMAVLRLPLPLPMM